MSDFKRKLYAFDVDHTLEVSAGPIKLNDIVTLCQEGHIAGLCGNFAMVTRQVENWHMFFSFIGPMFMKKHEFLTQLRLYVGGVYDHILVGNIGENGESQDKMAAQEAGFRFIKEIDFANGAR